jgi:hypothetical protein
MLSHKLLSIEKTVELAATAQVMPTQAVMRAVLRQLKDARSEAQELEARVVPRRQRLQMEDLADGKVTLFPVVAAPEAAS